MVVLLLLVLWMCFSGAAAARRWLLAVTHDGPV